MGLFKDKPLANGTVRKRGQYIETPKWLQHALFIFSFVRLFSCSARLAVLVFCQAGGD